MNKLILALTLGLTFNLAIAGAVNTDADVRHCLAIKGLADIVVKHKRLGVTKSEMYATILKAGDRVLTTTNGYITVDLVFLGYDANKVFDTCLYVQRGSHD